MLIDDGLLSREDGRWTPAGDMSQVTVPPTISALLSARLDRLSVEGRSVLDTASVVGKEFFLGAVRVLCPETIRGDVPRLLMSLVRKEPIRPERSTLPGEDAFRFRHLLIRDAAYEAIPKELRAELHERFADWLEKIASDRIEEQGRDPRLPPRTGLPAASRAWAGRRPSEGPGPPCRRAPLQRGDAGLSPRGRAGRCEIARALGRDPSLRTRPAARGAVRASRCEVRHGRAGSEHRTLRTAAGRGESGRRPTPRRDG